MGKPRKSDVELLRGLADFFGHMAPIEMYASEDDDPPVTTIYPPMLRVGPRQDDLEKALRRIADQLEKRKEDG